MTSTDKFIGVAKEEIIKIEKDMYGRILDVSEIEPVFLSYVMGFIKAIFVVAKNTDGRYFEVSYSFVNKKLFTDVYEKCMTKIVRLEEGDY